jgi:hypothetical protein
MMLLLPGVQDPPKTFTSHMQATMMLLQSCTGEVRCTACGTPRCIIMMRRQPRARAAVMLPAGCSAPNPAVLYTVLHTNKAHGCHQQAVQRHALSYKTSTWGHGNMRHTHRQVHGAWVWKHLAQNKATVVAANKIVSKN